MRTKFLVVLGFLVLTSPCMAGEVRSREVVDPYRFTGNVRVQKDFAFRYKLRTFPRRERAPLHFGIYAGRKNNPIPSVGLEIRF